MAWLSQLRSGLDTDGDSVVGSVSMSKVLQVDADYCCALSVNVTSTFNFRGYYVYPEIFWLVFHAIVTCIIAYIFWCIDNWACNEGVAAIRAHGWWHVFINLCFYYLVTFVSFLKAYTLGYEANIRKFPNKFPIFVTVTWNTEVKQQDVEMGNRPRSNQIAPEQIY